MRRALVAPVLIAGALLVAFMLTPQARVSDRILIAPERVVDRPPTDPNSTDALDVRARELHLTQSPTMVMPAQYEEKSGLRIAIEGRLHWLGLM